MSELSEETLLATQRSVEELGEEVRVLRQAVDELREVIEHLVRNIPPDFWEVLRSRRITSLPIDPTAPDFGARVNTISSEKIATLRASEARSTVPEDSADSAIHQRDLF